MNVRELLRVLDPAEGETAIDAELAYEQFRERFRGRVKEKGRWGERITRAWRRPAWGGVAAACALIALVSFAPGRTWAQKFLQMLRVEKLAVLPVDLSEVSGVGVAERGRGSLVAQFISDNAVVTMKPGEPVKVASPTEASERAGFKVRTLENMGTPEAVFVGDEGAFHMTLDRDRMEAVLAQAGRSDIQIPESVDGSTVAFHLPRSVRVLYGKCVPGDRPPALVNPEGAPLASNGGSCVEFVEVPSPTVSVPPNLDMAALAEAGLEITGMSAEEAHAFCKTVDWSSTLVIPIPRRMGSSYRTMAVDGVNGTFIEVPANSGGENRYALIWVKNGIVYSLRARGSAAEVLSAAESLN
jgi:hypothetical protein